MGHSGGSTSSPSKAWGILNRSGSCGAGTARQIVDSASDEDSIPKRVLGKRRGEQLASGDKSEKKGWFANVFPIIKAHLSQLATVRQG